MRKRRPTTDEYVPYQEAYISQVEGDDFLSTLKMSLPRTTSFLKDLPADKWEHTYEPGKWTIKEIMLHLIDTERIMAYRALRIARNDRTPLAGFEQDDYVPYSNASERTPDSIMMEYFTLRKSTIDLFKNFSDEVYDRLGTASDKPISVLALGYIIAGHELHHLEVIRDKYLEI